MESKISIPISETCNHILADDNTLSSFGFNGFPFSVFTLFKQAKLYAWKIIRKPCCEWKW